MAGEPDMEGTRPRIRPACGGVTIVLGLAALLALSGPAAAAGLVDGGFESGTLGGPVPTGPLPPSFGLWARESADSRLVSPPALVRPGHGPPGAPTRTPSLALGRSP